MSNYLKEKMQEKNITQIELAKRSGVSVTSINKYANGYNSMTIHNAFNLAIALGIDVGEFIKEMLKDE